MEVENKTNLEGQNVANTESLAPDVSGTAVSTAAINNNVPQNSAVVTPQKSKSNNTVIILVVLFGLLFLCCSCSIGGYFWSKSQVDSLVNEIESKDFEKIIEVPRNTDWESDSENVIDIPENIDWNNDSENVFTPDFQSMPGTTICDPILCSDTWSYVSMLGSVYISCNDLKLVNTKLDSKSADAKEWFETWTLDGCSKTYDFSVEFTSDPAGGTNFLVSKKF